MKKPQNQDRNGIGLKPVALQPGTRPETQFVKSDSGMGKGQQRREGPDRGRLQQVSELALPVLKPILSRRLGMNMDLIAAWPAIVGERHAACTIPEKIDWPRRANEADPFQPGVLVIACDGARAILLQHDTSWIIERVNSFFGFVAIGRIRILQKPVHRLNRDRQNQVREVELDKEAAARLSQTLKDVSDPQLKMRLEKLGRGVLSRQSQKAAKAKKPMAE